MDLSIISVNWNSKDYLRKCIASILSTAHGIDYEIIVIDCGSSDGCGEMLQEFYPRVRFIQSEINLGFAKANNHAAKEAIGEYILFLNPDTELENGALRLLLDNIKSLPGAGAVGAKLLNTDSSIQTSCIRSFPTLLNQFLDSEMLRRCFPRSRLWGMAPIVEHKALPVEVEAVSGACLMINRRIFESIGGFNTDYFMYSEDIDLCFKLRQVGRKTYYVPSSVIVHHGGSSSSKSNVNAFSSVMMLESRRRYFCNTKSVSYSRAYRLMMLFSSVIRICLLLLAWPAAMSTNKKAFLENLLRKWNAKFRWAVGMEDWVNNY